MTRSWISGLFVVSSVLALGCGSSADPAGSGGGGADGAVATDPDGGLLATDAQPVAEPNWDAYYADDPPPAYCGPDPQAAPPLPGGTPECPDDKNREGCGCDTVGERADCWPGKRVDRERGICNDGTTTCVASGEFGGRWSACQGYTLPTPGASGAAACDCFSAGTWELDNTSPCFVTYGNGQMYAVSTFMDNAGNAHCPRNISSSPPPAPEPGQPWSKNRLTVDCAGQYRLCYQLRAGDVETPRDSDCMLAQSCIDVWYETPGVAKELPVLPSWNSSNSTCARQFADRGGYGEMTVKGLSVECEAIDENGQAYVFHRVGYCSLACNENPNLPGCQGCSNGGSGSF